jgi:ABC transport system ATP-binding/permease protein
MIQLNKVSLNFGALNILDEADFNLNQGQKVALVGRNGTGKTTLMKLICGDINIDSGEIIADKAIKMAWLPQEVPNDIHGKIKDIVLEAQGDKAKVLIEWEEFQKNMESDPDNIDMDKMEKITHKLDDLGAWEILPKIEAVIGRMGLNADDEFSTLSGGMKRRVLLAQALVAEPDVLFLDEPTNHLDVESIEWIEDFLKRFNGTLLFVSHDRAFMRNVATRILELDRGKLFAYDTGYDKYLDYKEERLETEANQNALFDKKLAQEEVWIRQGVKARRTRNQGRVRDLEKLRGERSDRREVQGNVRMDLQDGNKSGRKVIDVKDLTYGWGGAPLVENLDLRVMRGDRLAVLGPNGCGKTTLLRLMLGQLKPDAGFVDDGTQLEITFFDQMRSDLDLEKTAMENLGIQGDWIEFADGRKKHVLGYLQDFLFTPDKARTAVKVLSGGERNRLLLARHFTKPSNLMILDEPTNDLDIETLELLEDIMSEFAGTILIVSHDREFIDKVATSTLVFEGDGTWNEYIGGYTDWIEQKERTAQMLKGYEKAKVIPKTKETTKPRSQKQEMAAAPASKPVQKKLSFNEKRELEKLPATIETLEAKQEELNALLLTDEVMINGSKLMEITAELEKTSAELDFALEKWTDLEERF